MDIILVVSLYHTKPIFVPFPIIYVIVIKNEEIANEKIENGLIKL